MLSEARNVLMGMRIVYRKKYYESLTLKISNLLTEFPVDWADETYHLLG